MATQKNYILELQQLQHSLHREFSFKALFYGLMQIFDLSSSYINHAWENDPNSNCANSDDQLESLSLSPKLERYDIGIQKRALFRFVKHDEDVREQLDLALQAPCLKNPKFKIPLVLAVSPSYICLFNAVENEFSSFALDSLPQNFALLQPLFANYTKRSSFTNSSEADTKACLKLIQLMDILEQCNDLPLAKKQSLNDFMRRLVFCLFAEDTGLFTPDLFTTSLSKLTGPKGEGSELFFATLFQVLNTPEDQRHELKVPQDILKFPYVDGELFARRCFIPKFNMLARNRLIDCGRMKWNNISPAIFGSLFQYALDAKERRQFGVHYTSEVNILKVIKPLFLDSLLEQVAVLENEYHCLISSQEIKQQCKEARQDLSQRVKAFHCSLLSIKIMDPACGCGNFLVISYRELRKLENRILRILRDLGASDNFADITNFVSIEQFYGIEIEEWPTEIAKLSMWLMQHQLNQVTLFEFGQAPASLPLSHIVHIRSANALTTDWNEILPAQDCSFVIGNPPFAGQRVATTEQKAWLKSVFPPKHVLLNIDFVAAWLVKAANYMSSNHQCHTAFVATHSICQGAQVEVLWSLLIPQGIFINFAYTSFQWKNETICNTDVCCVIIGFSYQDIRPALLFQEQKDGSIVCSTCQLISPYLIAEDTRTIVQKHPIAISAAHPIYTGNALVDNGHLQLDLEQGNQLIYRKDPAAKFIKLLIGSSELCQNTYRYCLWLNASERKQWSHIPLIDNKVKACQTFREQSTKTGDAYAYRNTPWKFRSQINPQMALVIPFVSSENRSYIPIDLINQDTIVSNLALLIPNPDMFDYAVLVSKIHNVWVKFTGGKLSERARYSKELSYNTFVWPELTYERKLKLCSLGTRIFDFCHDQKLDLGKLNHPDFMPIELKLLHAQLDRLIESYYRPQPFTDDAERLSFLIGLYSQKLQELVATGQDKGRARKKAYQAQVPATFNWQGQPRNESITPWLTPLNAYHIMVLGSTSADAGNLHLSQLEARQLLKDYPQAQKLIHRLISSQSFYGEEPTYCLWLTHLKQTQAAPNAHLASTFTSTSTATKDNKPIFGKQAHTTNNHPEPHEDIAKIDDKWTQIPLIKQRVEQCRIFRMSTDDNSVAYASREQAYRFALITYPPLTEKRIMMPRLIRKEYACIPIWLSAQPYVIDDSVCIVPTDKVIACALLNSRMHWVWMCATSEFDKQHNTYLYSIEKTYNTLIWPHIKEELKSKLTLATIKFMELTNHYAERFGRPLSLINADPEYVTAQAHLNYLVEQCYREQAFTSDQERLAFLKQLYLQYKF